MGLRNTAAIKRQIMARAVPAFREVNDELAQQFDREFEEVKWPWGGTTVTRSGNPVIKDSPRKIDDTQTLKKSRKMITVSEAEVVHRWGGPEADYAKIVLLGSRRRDGVSTPGRNWIRSGLQAYRPLAKMRGRL